MHSRFIRQRKCRGFTAVGFGLLLARGMLLPAFADATTSPKLDEVLVNASKSVERFWEQFPSVTCIESVRQEKVGNKGKIEYEQQSIFDYLIFMNLQGEDLTVEESRLLQKSVGKSKNLPLLITSGFPTLLLVFHPYYQGDYRYQLDGDDTLEGKRLMKVRFEHVSGTRSTSALRLRDRDYPLDLQGIAWIDPETGAIEKMVASLEAPMSDLNLKTLNVEVTYEPEQFSSTTGVEWLPSTATIDVETARQHWHNVHHFTNYKRFTVKSESTVSK